MSDPVSDSEFIRNFGRYKMEARRAAVPVSSQGQITGYFVGPDEYEAFMLYKTRRRVRSTVDLSDDEMKRIMESRMDARHDHLNALLDED